VTFTTGTRPYSKPSQNRDTTPSSRNCRDRAKPLAFALLAVALLGLIAAPSFAFEADRAQFALRYEGQVFPYQVQALFVAPSHQLDLEAVGKPGGVYSFSTDSGRVVQRDGRSWTWTAPSKPGLYRARVRDQRGSAIAINLFVLVPRKRMENGRLNGYRIGTYPSPPLRGLAVYRKPAGFVQVTPDILDTRLSPHFTLRQFLCKERGGFPKYVVLRETLLLKLEQILALVNSKGLHADTFDVLSGFRTPFYNYAIGNVKYSRHMFGDAADIFIDQSPRDGRMDDLNHDGKIDERDSEYLSRLVDQLNRHEQDQELIGGIGVYPETSNHGPFVHVDTRGFPAHWAG